MSGGGVEAGAMLIAHEVVHVDSWSRPDVPTGHTVAGFATNVNRIR
jgi:hypothetical protein